MFGYCSTGSNISAIDPNNRIKSATTHANTGRNTKNELMSRAPLWRCIAFDWCYPLPWPDLVPPINHDPVTRIQPFVYQPVTLLLFAKRYQPGLHGVILPNHQHTCHTIVGLHGTRGDKNAVLTRA